ncbi:hypothetical protein J40TS1_06140 [Paenibacillus montaniterrae]|uniref:Transposase n=1 Tax=Paenibacillus montaniterrae TaxID=429341 RepID=A0A919YIH0_9BACL|nr:hypothetical protein [Paenibacillus montaniterrae]GIP14972.1 hypothetical protein J40TS1_06140 [Paenibacillus montaniterrae]
MKRYDKAFKEEAVRLSHEVGPKKAAEQLDISYYTLSEKPCMAKARIVGADTLMPLPIKPHAKWN